MHTIRLSNSLGAWGTPRFSDVLKAEVAQLGAARLPLQQGLTRGSHALDGDLTVLVKHVAEDADCIRVRAGIFYKGIIAGCSCADDPTPVEAHDEYCEVQLDIDKRTAETAVALVAQ